MGKALYRKYRSKKLSEIVGQEHITTTLENALKNGRISHAYLFTGPRGVGKTSIARILAHEVNGIPYDEDATNMDIIEIDAASNRRIDEIRDLRDKIHIAPSHAKYKVYIIDEVHMLTREAFNALLKTLEEPPAHAIFILATTEAHKLPETIISRTQRFSFKPIDEVKAVEHLKSIAKSEKITASDDALKLIAKHGDGSFRDSISLLDQASTVTEKIELADVQALLGIAPAERITKLYETLLGGSPQLILSELADLRAQGYNAANVAKQLAGHIRSLMLEGKLGLEQATALKLLEDLLRVANANDSDALLEIILLGAVLDTSSPPTAVQKPVAVEVSPITATVVTEPKEQPKQPKAAPQASKPVETTVEPDITPLVTLKPDATTDEAWQAVLKSLKSKYNTLHGVLRMATPMVEGNKLILGFTFAFHQKRINEAKNKEIVANMVQEVFGKPYAIECQLIDKHAAATATPASPAKQDDGALDTISNIFGGAEVLES